MSLDAIPVVSGATLLGHIDAFQRERLGLFVRAREYGPLARVRFLHQWAVCVSSPAAAHEVLVTRAAAFEKAPALRTVVFDLAGEGLFTSEGDLWRRQRRLLAPLFQPSAIEPYAAAMADVTARVVNDWNDGARFDLAHETIRIAAGVASKALFDSDSFGDGADLERALEGAIRWSDAHASAPSLRVQLLLADALRDARPRAPASVAPWLDRALTALRGPVLVPGARSGAHAESVRFIDTRVGELIEARRRRGLDGRDLLTRLLAARDAGDGPLAGMSDRQVRDEVVTAFVAGHETTATALAWSIYLLGRDPVARAAVQAEVDALPPGPVTFAAAATLTRTLRVFKEAMRLYPPLAVLARRSLEPVEVAGCVLPRRTLVMISPYAIHRDPSVYPDPERFDPERFAPDREAARPKSAYLPFGAGPRVCIGSHFALLEGPVVLATLMRSVRFEVDPTQVEPESFHSLRPKGGIWVTAKRAVSPAG